MWVQGDSKAYGNELLPVGENAAVKPPEMVGWRVELEHEVLRQSEVLNAVILRPGLLFGGTGSYIGMLWWSPIQQAIANHGEAVELGAKEDTILALVHKDDMGKAVVKTVEKVRFFPDFLLSVRNSLVSLFVLFHLWRASILLRFNLPTYLSLADSLTRLK
jgi:nucleoside-diphosphate-sugar epimerase